MTASRSCSLDRKMADASTERVVSQTADASTERVVAQQKDFSLKLGNRHVVRAAAAGTMAHTILHALHPVVVVARSASASNAVLAQMMHR